MKWEAVIHPELSSAQENLVIYSVDPLRHITSVLVKPSILTFDNNNGTSPIDDIVFMKGSFFAHTKEIDGFLQGLMDLAWSRGLRPKGANPHAAEMTAMQAHLEDMRKLAFGKEKI